jgi:ribosomal protein L14
LAWNDLVEYRPGGTRDDVTGDTVAVSAEDSKPASRTRWEGDFIRAVTITRQTIGTRRAKGEDFQGIDFDAKVIDWMSSRLTLPGSRKSSPLHSMMRALPRRLQQR